MKKKFILLAMMLLTLIGGVKFNVLNAQETITIGEGSSTTLQQLPTHLYYNYTYSQQIYLEDEIGLDNCMITDFIFTPNFDNTGTRKWKVYMTNTEQVDLASGVLAVDDESLVYDGDVKIANREVKVTLSSSFEYLGNNILITIEDYTGSFIGNGLYFLTYNTFAQRSLSIYSDGQHYTPENITSYNPTKRSSNNQIKLIYQIADDIIPAAPTNLTATAINHESVSLSWTAGDENALKYNIYQNGTKIGSTSETSYTVEGLTAETDYCFTVEAVRGVNVSETKSNEACATTLEYNDPLVGKQFRLRALTYIKKYDPYYYGPYDFYSAKYLYIDNYNAAGLKVIDKVDSNAQRFTFEPTGVVEGQYYLRSADGYYINCAEWDVSAYGESQKSPIEVVYLDDTQTQFYLTNGTGRHFKVETDYYETQPYVPYCDAAQQYAAKWIVEEVAFTATATTGSNSIYDDQTTTLSVTAMDGSGNYTYSWSPANGLSDAAGANPTFTPTAAGEHTFTCTVTDTESGSTAEASVTVYVNARPALQLTVSADKELIYNDGETAVLTATVTEGTGYAPYTYSWTLNETEVYTEATYAFSSETVGVYNLTCTVTDARNNIQTASTTIEVKDESEKPLEIVLGTDNTGNPGSADGYIPTNTYYNYSLTQQIYTKNEIGKDGNIIINSIAFKESAGQTTTRKLSIYIQNTTETSVSSLYYMNDNDLCFTGNVTFNPYEWTVITLNTPFEYDATQNILLCVDDNTGSYQNGRTFATYYNGEGGSIYTYNDNINFEPKSPTMSNGNTSGSKNHIRLGYEIPAPKPENLVATPAQIHVGETTTLTWNELEGAESYNIYVDGVLNGNTEYLTYGLSDLNYNVEPGHTIEVAAVYADATESGKASVTVQVAGTFTLTVNVTDGTNPIEGATVNVTTDQWTYDEFGNNIASLSSLLTDENGQAVFNNVKLLNPDTYCAYSISATMDVYGTHSTTPLANYESVANGGNVTRTIVMTLPEPKNITADKELYIAGEDVVLTWETPEFNTRAFLGYNVYSVMDGDYDLGTETSYTKLNEETLTETTYTIKDVEYDAKFAVSAVYDEGESSKVNANVQITAYANLVVNVKDANTLAGIDGAVVEIYSYRTGETETFVTANGGIVEEEYLLGNYTVTVKKNDSHYEVEPQEAQLVYGNVAELEFELTPKASIENVTVTADNTGYVSWTGDYAKWNVYRRNTNAPQELETVATGVTTTSTTDTEWETLEPGTYQYGVAALVEPQAQTRGTEVVFEEGFESGIGNWTAQENSWTVTSDYHNSGSNAIRYYCSSFSYVTRTLTSPNIQINELPNPRLSFYLINNGNNTPTLSVKINVKKNDEEYDQYDFTTISDVFDNFTKFEYSLEQYVGKEIQIVFLATSTFGSNTIVDDIVIYSEIPAVETQIVWSDEVEKKAPVMFYAYEDTDWNNPNNWNVKRVPTAEDEVVILTSVNISSEANANSLNIASGSTVTVDENGVLNVAAGITNNGSLVLNDGGQIFQNNANIYAKFNMGIENPTSWSDETSKDGWQFISSPFNAAQISLFTGSFMPRSYDLYKYDGGEDYEWINHKSETEFEETFVNGRGYLASYETLTSVELAGYLYYAKSFTWDNLTHAEKDLANFHLLGNPFTFDMDMSKATYTNLVEGYAVVNPADGGYKYFAVGSSQNTADGTIKVGDGFFVKATGEDPSFSYNVESRAKRGESFNSLNLIATGNAGEDNVVINFAGKSEGFDKLQNFNDAIATVYVAEDGKNYGIYNCDADVQEVELSFNANKMGNYTISIEPNGKFQTVTLVDRFTGVETNMLVEDYNFTAMSEENPNRFIVRFANGQQTTDNSHFVYQSGEELILNIQGEVQIVDVLGRVVYNGEAMNDINRINVSSFNSGAYMVKVMNGNEVKVEKVVIY